MSTTGNVVSGSVGTDLSYEEYKKKYGEQLETEHADMLKAIADERKLAYDRAIANEQSAILDAQNSYARNLSSYGAKADALASMGLAGSGYSQHLDSQTYAQQRRDIDTAAAQKSAAQNETDLSYSKNVRDTNALYRDYKNQNNEELYSYRNNQQNIVNDQINTFKNAALDGTLSVTAVDQLYNNGNNPYFTQAEYDNIKALYFEGLDTSENYFSGMSKEMAQESLNNPWLKDTAQGKKLQESFDKVYNIVIPAIGSSSVDASVSDLGEIGAEITVNYGGKSYDVESAGEITDSAVVNAGNDVGDNQLFGYQGRLFVKRGGRVFEIKTEGDTVTDAFAELTDRFFNGADVSSRELKELEEKRDAVNKIISSVEGKSNEEKAEAAEALKKYYPEASLGELLAMVSENKKHNVYRRN